jgi:hypothetical protein
MPVPAFSINSIRCNRPAISGSRTVVLSEATLEEIIGDMSPEIPITLHFLEDA